MLPLGNGRRAPEIAVPVCRDCWQQAQAPSEEADLLRQIRRRASGVAALAAVIIVLLVTPESWGIPLRLLAALPFAAVAAASAYLLLRGAVAQAVPPEKRAVLDAVRVEQRSRRATTFVFTNEAFAQRFREVNEPILLET